MRTAALLTVLLCSVLAFDPAVAETPAAACLSASGQRLYNIRLYRNTPLPPGCKAGDSLVRFQIEQPGTRVSKLRNTLTAPGEQVLWHRDGIVISQIYDPDARCWIQVSIPGNAIVLGASHNDIAVDGADYMLGDNVVDGQGFFDGSMAGGPSQDLQFFLSLGEAVFVEDVVVMNNFGPVRDDGCFVAATVRYAKDARSMYAP